MVNYFTSAETWDSKIYLMSLLPVQGGSAFLTQIEELDWIRAVGHTAVCMTPVFQCVPEYSWDRLPDPYRILNHREINRDYGSIEDFLRLVDEIHLRGLKCILEVVMDSLSKASPLFAEHPEYFIYHERKRERFRIEKLLKQYHVTYEEFVKETGLTENDFNGDYGDPDWDKTLRLDYGNPGLCDYQEETLAMWAKYADGFRCIAAPRVPMTFWERVQRTIGREKPEFIWILVDEKRPETIDDYL